MTIALQSALHKTEQKKIQEIIFDDFFAILIVLRASGLKATSSEA